MQLKFIYHIIVQYDGAHMMINLFVVSFKGYSKYEAHIIRITKSSL